MRCAQIWTAPAGWSSATGCCWRCWSGGCRVTRRTVSSRPQPRQYTGEGNRSGRACSIAAGSRPAIWTGCSSTAITCDTSTRFWSGLGFLVVVSLRGPKGRSNPLLHRRVLATPQIWTANLRGPRQRGAPRNDCWEALTVSVESRITNHESREVLQTSLPLPLYGRGKVRDVYEAGEDLLIVATDRISASDHVLPTPVPDKGRVLTPLSAFWVSCTGSIVANHMIAWDPVEIVRRVPGLDAATLPVLAGRPPLVPGCERIGVGCVVRGYLTGCAGGGDGRPGAWGGGVVPPGVRDVAGLAEP